MVHNLSVAPVTSPFHITRPSDFFLFGHLQKHLTGKRFVTDADMKQDVTSWLQNLATDFFYSGIQSLVQQWDKCVMSILTTLRSDVYYLLHIFCVYSEVRIKFAAYCIYYTLLFETHLCLYFVVDFWEKISSTLLFSCHLRVEDGCSYSLPLNWGGNQCLTLKLVPICKPVH